MKDSSVILWCGCFSVATSACIIVVYVAAYGMGY